MIGQSHDVSGTVFEDPFPGLTRVYSEALVNASGANADAVLDELDALIADLWDARPDFEGLLTSPSRSAAEKDRILVTALEPHVGPEVLNFLRVLNRHGRLGLLRTVVQHARTIQDRRQNHLPVRVRSAVPLDHEQELALHARLAAMTGTVPVVQLDVDPSILGGLVIEVGDVKFDASVQTLYLDKLLQKLLEEMTPQVLAQRAKFQSA